VALGLIFAVSPQWTMPVFGVAVGLAIMAMQRRSSLSTDTVIGVVFAAVMAFGLAMVSREAHVARDLQRFLYGDILTIGDGEVLVLAGLFVAVGALQFLGYNRLLYIGLHPVVAQAHRVRVGMYQYVFAGLLALVVMLSIWAVGVLLVTALLIVPAAAARNLARSPGRCSGGRCWSRITSAAAGLVDFGAGLGAHGHRADGGAVRFCLVPGQPDRGGGAPAAVALKRLSSIPWPSGFRGGGDRRQGSGDRGQGTGDRGRGSGFRIENSEFRIQNSELGGRADSEMSAAKSALCGIVRSA
jgi:ABC-type Mn2+/Zn2+ transport system permease subunit